jgi:meso-butanediol dehydrogenase / (S,S)-butanediol dehydrogenase / diacetyl reductase
LRGEPVVLVVGAAGRLGSAIAGAIAGRGGAVVLADTDEAALERVAGAVPGSEALVADVRDDQHVTVVVERVLERYGTLHGCVNAVGFDGPVERLEAVPMKLLREVFETNVFAAARLMQAVLPVFRGQRAGRMVHIASGSGLAGTEYMACYSASKHALVGLIRSVAREVAADAVSVNAVCPGPIASPMMARIEERHTRVTGKPLAYETQIPAGRYADPGEVAEVTAYLATEAPSYLTGQAIVVDGALRA